MNPLKRRTPEHFGEIVTRAQIEAYFLYFNDYLTPLGFTEELAAMAFLQDYYSSFCPWSDEEIPNVFQRVALENNKKYEKLCSIYSAVYDPILNYDRTDEETTTRTPDLTTERSGETSGSENRETQKNQVEHRADKPAAPEGSTWSETTETSVSPYDASSNEDYYAREKVERTETGWRDTETSYTGEPDTESTTHSGTDSSTTTETGTDETVRELHSYGNIGSMSSQTLAEQELALAEKMNIFRTIEKDLAAKLFLQVW